jgi:hypothetical protein
VKKEALELREATRDHLANLESEVVAQDEAREKQIQELK